MRKNSSSEPCCNRDHESPAGNPRQFQFVAVCMGSILLAGSLFLTVKAYGKAWGHSARKMGFAPAPTPAVQSNSTANAASSSFE